jgi:uncharacterized protein YrrD
MRLELGEPVRCTDDAIGKLADVVIDPAGRRVTHLVVQPRHGYGLARLVPVKLVKGGDREISLGCTVEEMCRLPTTQQFAYLQAGDAPADDPDWDVGIEDVLPEPHYETTGFGEYPAAYDPNVEVTYDRVPKGEVEVRRSSAVTSADGHAVGDVHGFVLDDEERITHLLLVRGHLWRRREVTIPIAAVSKLETDSVTVSLTRDQVKALPASKAHRVGGGR